MGMSPSDRNLIAVIEPDGGYALDWQYVSCDIECRENGVDQIGIEYQMNIYDTYLADSDLALLMLGTAGRAVTLSETAGYLSRIASAFVKSLTENPDLETLRDRAKAVLDPGESEMLLSEAPFIIGSEHLDEDWISCACARLNAAFSNVLIF